MLDRINDAIAAIASPPGAAQVGVVRLSGPCAIEIVASLFVSDLHEPLLPCDKSRRVEGRIRLDVGCVAPAFLYVYPAPHGYTRQNAVEIFTVGSPPLLHRLMQNICAAGARLSEPGEFTARAFLHGAMPLTSAQAVAAIIRARTDGQLRAARHVASGFVHKQLVQMRDRLMEAVALVEAGIDFAEEPIEFIRPDQLRKCLADVSREMQTLLSRTQSIQRCRATPSVLLLGPPNAGKSTLMNRLSNLDRSICSSSAGTTRDLLSAPVALRGFDALLWDSAGIDDPPDGVLGKAQAATLDAAASVDAVCIVLDASATVPPAFLERIGACNLPDVILVLNKSDLATVPISLEPDDWIPSIQTSRAIRKTVLTSAMSGAGMEQLRDHIREVLAESAVGSSALDELALGDRQITALRSALQSVERAAQLAARDGAILDCAELIAFEIREALDFLGVLTGEVTTEDLLGAVFARFCIGK